MYPYANSVNNPIGRTISWNGIRRAKSIIERSSALFGLTPIAFVPQTYGIFFNADALAARLEQMADMRRRTNYTPGFAAEWLSIAKQIGYIMGGGNVNPAPTGLVASLVTQVSATVDWADYPGGVIGYDVVLTGNGVWIKSQRVVPSVLAMTDLVPNTVHKFYVAAVISGLNISSWASTTFTTLP
jgi:hypothetical protein